MDAELLKYLEKLKKTDDLKPVVVRPLEQMYQTEFTGARAALVESLSATEGKEATQALARRAIFDLVPSVRRQAVKELKGRTLDDARPIFLAALRHPWPAAADHAAIALADLNDQDAVAGLKKLLDQPDPRQPYPEGKRWFVPETVRVNHLRNCLLCHPPSTSIKDVVIGPIPTPGQPLPIVYYGSDAPSVASAGRSGAIRADVVYFRQDFSVMHEVAKPDPWPAVQRFDYMVRTRKLTEKEVAALGASAARKAKDKTYSQREAVRYALAALAEISSRGRGR